LAHQQPRGLQRRARALVGGAHERALLVSDERLHSLNRCCKSAARGEDGTALWYLMADPRP
jgi:hypothetical protein